MMGLKPIELAADQFIIDSADYHWFVRKSPAVTKQIYFDNEVLVWVSQCYINSNDELVTRAEIYCITFNKDAIVRTYDRDEMAALLRA